MIPIDEAHQEQHVIQPRLGKAYATRTTINNRSRYQFHHHSDFVPLITSLRGELLRTNTALNYKCILSFGTLRERIGCAYGRLRQRQRANSKSPLKRTARIGYFL